MSLLLRMPRRVGIDDEGTVKPLVNVTFQRHRVAVIEVTAEGNGIEFVDEGVARRDLARARHAVHARGVDSMEVHGVRMRSGVGKSDTDPIALCSPDCRTRDAAVEGPGRKDDAGCDFDFFVFGEDVELPEPAAVGEHAGAALIPVGQDVGGIESIAGMIDLADREHAAMARVMLCSRACRIGFDRRMLDHVGLLAACYPARGRQQRKSAGAQRAPARHCHPAPPIVHRPPPGWSSPSCKLLSIAF